MEVLGISQTNLLLWMVFGALISFIIHVNDHKRVTGCIFATLIFGVFGAVISGYLTSFLLGIQIFRFSLEVLFLSLIGAIVIIIFYRNSFRHRKDY